MFQKKQKQHSISNVFGTLAQVSKQSPKLTIFCFLNCLLQQQVLLAIKCEAKRAAATFDSAQIWAELLMLQAKQSYGNIKEISPDKSKQAHHKLGMTIDTSLSCQMHGCNQPIPTSVLIFIKASSSFTLL